jgi:hypothetical protein
LKSNLLILRVHLGLAGLEFPLDFDELRVVLLHALPDATDPLSKDHCSLRTGGRRGRGRREKFIVILTYIKNTFLMFLKKILFDLAFKIAYPRLT